MTVEHRQLRAFIALQFEPKALAHLTQCALPLKTQWSGQKVRWLPAHQYHLTLQFLGKVERDHLAFIDTQLAYAASTTAPMQLSIEKVDYFPSHRNPQVIALKMAPHSPLAALSRAMIDSLSCHKFVYTHAFMPHITLARLARGVTLLPLPNIKPFTVVVKRFALYESELLPKGAQYTVLKTYAFTGASGRESE